MLKALQARLQPHAAHRTDRLCQERDAVLQAARASFIGMQAAWDAADLGQLGRIAAPALLADLREQLQARGPAPNRTVVVSLHAELLGMDKLGEALLASVEFTGLMRERPGGEAAPFRELWFLAKHESAGGGWKLARVQALS